MCVITTAFEGAARARLGVLGMKNHPIVAMRHPLGTRTPEELRGIAAEIVEAIAHGLTRIE